MLLLLFGQETDVVTSYACVVVGEDIPESVKGEAKVIVTIGYSESTEIKGKVGC